MNEIDAFMCLNTNSPIKLFKKQTFDMSSDKIIMSERLLVSTWLYCWPVEKIEGQH
jgi:hypothetical protein